MKFYRSPFLRDFWHLNVAMMTSNNALIPDPDKEDILASVPTDWPLMRLGLRMCAWTKMQTKYYLIGTPVIWWGTTASLVISVVAFCVYVFRMQRRYVDMEPSTCRMLSNENLSFFPPRKLNVCDLHTGEWEHFLYVGKIALFGWMLHFRTCLIHTPLPSPSFALLPVHSETYMTPYPSQCHF